MHVLKEKIFDRDCKYKSSLGRKPEEKKSRFPDLLPQSELDLELKQEKKVRVLHRWRLGGALARTCFLLPSKLRKVLPTGR